MKRVHFQALLDDAQREQSKLKDELVELRRHLSAYQSVLAQQLKILGHPPDHYDSLFDALNSFISHYRASSEALALKTHQFSQTKKSLAQSEAQVTQLTKLNQQLINNQKELEKSNRNLQELRQIEVKKLAQKVEEANQAVAKTNERLAAFKRQVDFRQIEAGQRQRSAIASAISAARQELVDFRKETQRQYNEETKKMREELRIRDENLRQLSKMLQKCETGKHMQEKQLQSVMSIVKSLSDVDQLNQIVAQQREEIAGLRREIKEANNRKISTEARLNESKVENMNLISKLERKEKLIEQQETKREEVVKDLQATRKANSVLEHYYEGKWVKQFEKVKQHLEKVFADKIKQNEAELQRKKAEVSQKIESYQFIHKEDQKLIGQLQKQLTQSKMQTRQGIDRQIVLQRKVEELFSQLRQTNVMILEQEQGMSREIDIRNQNLRQELEQLQGKLSRLTQDSQAQEKMMQEQADKLDKIAKEEINKIEIAHLKEKEILKQAYKANFEKINQQAAASVAALQRQIQMVREDGKRQLLELQNKMKAEAARQNREMQKEREKHRQQEQAGNAREYALRVEIKDTRNSYQLKIEQLQKELELRKDAVKRNIDKSQNDQELKKELRELIETKVAENKRILAEKQDLAAQVQVDSCIVYELREEVAKLTFTRDDWLQAIDTVKLQMQEQINSLKKIHGRTVELLKSKIWELEQKILKRPGRVQDQKKIRNLSEQKQQLQQKVQLQQAENIILQQLRHHYELKNVLTVPTSQMSLTATDFKKPQGVAILSRKPKRMRHTLNQFSQEEDQGETVKDMKRMRKYLLERRQASGDRSYLKTTIRSRG